MSLNHHNRRRANLLLLVQEAGGIDALAARTRVTPAALQQVLSGQADHHMGEQMARQLERGMDKAFGWMDRASDGPAPSTLREGLHPSVIYGIAGARRRWLLLQVAGGSLEDLARRIRVDAVYLQQVADGRLPFESALARQVEQALGKPLDWLDETAIQTADIVTIYHPKEGSDDSRTGNR